MLTVKNLKSGVYTLQIKREAYVKVTKLHRDQQFTIEVVDKVKSISSNEDLKKYFETYLALEQAAYKRIENEATFTEESSSNSTMDQSLGAGDKGSDYAANRFENCSLG